MILCEILKKIGQIKMRANPAATETRAGFGGKERGGVRSASGSTFDKSNTLRPGWRLQPRPVEGLHSIAAL